MNRATLNQISFPVASCLVLGPVSLKFGVDNMRFNNKELFLALPCPVDKALKRVNQIDKTCTDHLAKVANVDLEAVRKE